MSLADVASSLDSARNEIAIALSGRGATVPPDVTLMSASVIISSLPSSGAVDVSSTTAEAGDVLSGKVFYNSGGSLTSGTIPTVSATSSGSQVTVPTGYIASSQTFNVSGGVDVSDTTAIGANVLSGYAFYDSAGVKTTGTIPTVSASRAAMNIVDVPSGYIAVEQSIVVGDLTSGGVITPATENQVISSGAFLDGSMTILGDSNLVASNILSGVSIFGVSGTLVTSGGAEVTLGYINSDGEFQPLAFSGIIPSDSGSAVDLPCYTWMTPGESSGGSSGGSGGDSSGGTISSGVHASIGSGETWESTTVNSGGWLFVRSGGSATGTIVSSDGYFFIGGNATNTTGNHGYIFIEGGTATSTTVNEGHITVARGTANSTTVNSAPMYIQSGGIANYNTLNNGRVYVYSGGTINNTTVNSHCHIQLRSGGTVNSTTVNASGHLYVSSGGTANNVTVSSGGKMVIYSGGVTSNVTSMTGAVIINS